MDYACAKGAIVAFTGSLALNLAANGIRVDRVAPGPIRALPIPPSFDEKEVETFGRDAAKMSSRSLRRRRYHGQSLSRHGLRSVQWLAARRFSSLRILAST